MVKMSHPFRTFATAIVLGLLLASQSGCLLVAAAAGTGAGVAFVTGDTETTLDASPQAVVNATELAFKDLDLSVISKESSGLDGKVIGRTARDVKLTVVVKGQSERVSKVSIRTGVFGDDPMQYRILEKIRQHLGDGGAPVATGPTTSPTTQPAGVATSAH
jgi:hypothetical protein